MALPPDPLKNLLGTGTTPEEWYTLVRRAGCLTWKGRRQREAMRALLAERSAAYRPSATLGSLSLPETLIYALLPAGYLSEQGYQRFASAVSLDGAIDLARQILAERHEGGWPVGWLTLVPDGVEHLIMKLAWRPPASIPAPASRSIPTYPVYEGQDEPVRRSGTPTQPVGLRTIAPQAEAELRCPDCRRQSPHGARFCVGCGRPTALFGG